MPPEREAHFLSRPRSRGTFYPILLPYQHIYTVIGTRNIYCVHSSAFIPLPVHRQTMTRLCKQSPIHQRHPSIDRPSKRGLGTPGAYLHRLVEQQIAVYAERTGTLPTRVGLLLTLSVDELGAGETAGTETQSFIIPPVHPIHHPSPFTSHQSRLPQRMDPAAPSADVLWLVGGQ